VAFGHEGSMVREYRQCGHSVSVVPHKNWLRRSHPARFLRDLYVEIGKARTFRALLSDTRPALVYVNTAVSLAAAVAARRMNIPCVWHLRELFHDEGGEMRAPGVARPFISHTIRRLASRVVANSDIVARNMLGPRHAQAAEVVPNCVDECFFTCVTTPSQARLELGLPPQGILIGVPGTLRAAKGQPFFLDALHRLRRRDIDVFAVITGTGEAAFEDQLERQMAGLGLASRVFMPGEVRNMASFYRACDLICVPSRSESFGRVVIEAFASGSPVIATAVGGINDIVRDGEDGVLTPYGDVESLAAKMEELIEQADVRARLASRAREKAEALYREPGHGARINRIVEEVTGQSPE
jgi:glycosyltransferase involved in cell wall biosynthesis